MFRVRIACCFVLAFLSLLPAQADIFKVRIPRGMYPAKVTVVCGQYGHGLGLQQETKRMGNDFLIDIFPAERSAIAATKRVKLLIFCPGYKVVTADLDVAKGETSKPFIPAFRRIPMVPIRVRLENSSGQPIMNVRVAFLLDLDSFGYFGYSDGESFGARALEAVSDSRGEFTTSLPSLLDDPYLAKGSFSKRQFAASLPREFRLGKYGYYPTNGIVPARRSYPGTFVMRFVPRGRFSASLGREFLRKHGITATGLQRRTQMVVSGPGTSGESSWVHRDGSFSCDVAPGTYDVSLQNIKTPGGNSRTLWSIKRVTIRENEQKKLLIE